MIVNIRLQVYNGKKKLCKEIAVDRRRLDEKWNNISYIICGFLYSDNYEPLGRASVGAL